MVIICSIVVSTISIFLQLVSLVCMHVCVSMCVCVCVCVSVCLSVCLSVGLSDLCECACVCLCLSINACVYSAHTTQHISTMANVIELPRQYVYSLSSGCQFLMKVSLTCDQN